MKGVSNAPAVRGDSNRWENLSITDRGKSSPNELPDCNPAVRKCCRQQAIASCAEGGTTGVAIEHCETDHAWSYLAGKCGGPGPPLHGDPHVSAQKVERDLRTTWWNAETFAEFGLWITSVIAPCTFARNASLKTLWGPPRQLGTVPGSPLWWNVSMKNGNHRREEVIKRGTSV